LGRSIAKISGSGSASGSESGSISQRHGSADPDPDPPQNVMDPQHYCHPINHLDLVLMPKFPGPFIDMLANPTKHPNKGWFGQGHYIQGMLCPRDARSKKLWSGTHWSGRKLTLHHKNLGGRGFRKLNTCRKKSLYRSLF
jgi:hypothetical protein